MPILLLKPQAPVIPKFPLRCTIRFLAQPNIYPYLAYESLAQRVDKKILSGTYAQVMLNYRNGINKGLYKIMSKMGISTRCLLPLLTAI